MTSAFSMVPERPLEPDAMAAYRDRLGRFPVYEVPGDDVYVVFGTPEERKETVALFTRLTAPTFDAESFVQLRPDRILVHLGSEPGGVAHVREFVSWAVEERAHQLQRGERALTLEEALG